MKSVLAAVAIAVFATPAAADWAPGRSAAASGWHPDTAFPSTPAIQRYGKGMKGMRRFQRGQIREAQFRRFQEEVFAFRSAAVRMEDSRGRCDRKLEAALASGNQAEIEEARDYCKPRAYGPQLR